MTIIIEFGFTELLNLH